MLAHLKIQLTNLEPKQGETSPLRWHLGPPAQLPRHLHINISELDTEMVEISITSEAGGCAEGGDTADREDTVKT